MRLLRGSLFLALIASASLNQGCDALRNPSAAIHGTMSCSCRDMGCGCKHCTAESAECPCRATDAYGGGSSITRPDGD
jgi:hypothetical protein